MIVTDGCGNNRVIRSTRPASSSSRSGRAPAARRTRAPGPASGTCRTRWRWTPTRTSASSIARTPHQVFDKNLTYIREIRNDWNPWDIAISHKGTDGIGWIADHKDRAGAEVQLKDGKILATWGKQGLGPGGFDWVHGIVVDSKGAVYAADTYGQRIQKFVPSAAGSGSPDYATKDTDTKDRTWAMRIFSFVSITLSLCSSTIGDNAAARKRRIAIWHDQQPDRQDLATFSFSSGVWNWPEESIVQAPCACRLRRPSQPSARRIVNRPGIVTRACQRSVCASRAFGRAQTVGLRAPRDPDRTPRAAAETPPTPGPDLQTSGHPQNDAVSEAAAGRLEGGASANADRWRRRGRTYRRARRRWRPACARGRAPKPAWPQRAPAHTRERKAR